MADESLVTRCINCAYGLIEAGCQAQAATFLFDLHKRHFDEWIVVQKRILNYAKNIKELQAMTLIVRVSSMPTLEQSSHLIPGLDALIDSQEICEFLD